MWVLSVHSYDINFTVASWVGERTGISYINRGALNGVLLNFPLDLGSRGGGFFCWDTRSPGPSPRPAPRANRSNWCATLFK